MVNEVPGGSQETIVVAKVTVAAGARCLARDLVGDRFWMIQCRESDTAA